MDLESGRILHIGQGKGKDALEGFWRRRINYMKERLRLLLQSTNAKNAATDLHA